MRFKLLSKIGKEIVNNLIATCAITTNHKYTMSEKTFKSIPCSENLKTLSHKISCELLNVGLI